MDILQIQKFVNDKTIKSLKNLLGSNFSPMASFFKKAFLSFDRNICSILITRRCFLMALWFLGFLAKQGSFDCDFEFSTINSCLCIRNRKTGRVNYIISDKGMPLLRAIKDIEEIHILDDICIHGRQLEKIKTAACEFSGLSDNRVQKWVFMCSRDSLILDVEHSEIDVTKGGWVLPSQSIVESINYLLLPYVSYTNSFVKFNVSIKDNDDFLDRLEGDNTLIVKEFGKDNRLQLGKQSFYIVERDECAISGEHSNLACLRYYYNFETRIASFIPYVVLQTLPQGIDEPKLRTYLLQYLNEQSVNLIIDEVNHLFNGNNYREGRGYLYSLLSCIASCHYGICFAVKHKLDEFDFVDNRKGWDEDIINSMAMAFGEKIATIIANYQNYVMTNKECLCHNESCMDLIDMKKETDDFEATRWTQRELAVEGFASETSDNEIFILMQSAVERHNHAKYATAKGILMHSFLRSVISDCDNGRLNISSPLKTGKSLLEVGELGVLTVREKDDITIAGVRQLLRKPYYYYILC